MGKLGRETGGIRGVYGCTVMLGTNSGDSGGIWGVVLGEIGGIGITGEVIALTGGVWGIVRVLGRLLGLGKGI